jgi:hypothetical protein
LPPRQKSAAATTTRWLRDSNPISFVEDTGSEQAGMAFAYALAVV